METGALAVWRSSQSPFAIQYSRRTLEGVRLAVVDAFFSLPRGGVEIGGILLGKFRNQQVEIADYAPLECEHAFGPSFTLSQRDQQNLEDLLAAIRARADGNGPVGWYHSHNRSDIFLSDADLEIHRRYFPEPWQVALVLRPSLSQPMRAGFFFREADGSIQAAATYQEFALEPFHGIAINAADAAPAPRPPDPPPVPLPGFLAAEPAKPRRLFWIRGAVAAAAVVTIAALLTRGGWGPPLENLLPRAAASSAASPASSVPAVSIDAIDNQGQLQIHWNPAAGAAAAAQSAVLTLTDGTQEQRIPLDGAQLRAGSFTYTRHNERVDVRLTMQAPSGPVETATTFLGAAPAPLEAEAAAANAEAAALARQNEELRRQAALLQQQLDSQTAHAKALETQLNELRKQPERKRTGGANRMFDPLE